MSELAITIGGSSGFDKTFWLQAGGFAIAIGTLFIALLQIKRAIATFNTASLTNALNTILADTELREDRKALFRGEISPEPERLPRESSRAFEKRRLKLWRIATLHDRYAMTANNAGPSRNDVLLFQIDEIQKTWELLKPFILDVRTSEDRPNYCTDLERLYRYSQHGWFRFRVGKRFVRSARP